MKRISLLILVLFSIIGCAPMAIEDFADNTKEAIANQYIETLLKDGAPP